MTLSSIGLPGMNGFVGEFTILTGAFKFNIPYAVVATLGIIFAAVYMLWMFQRVMFGEITHDENKSLKDLSKREIAILVPIIILIFWIGIYPKPFLSRMEPALNKVLQKVHSVEQQTLHIFLSDTKP